MASEGLMINAQDLSEKYALACLMLCDLIKSVDENMQELTPANVDQSFVDMIADGESPIEYVKKIVVEDSSQEVH